MSVLTASYMDEGIALALLAVAGEERGIVPTAMRLLVFERQCV